MKKIVLIITILAALSGCYNRKADKLYPTPPATVCDTSGVISYATDITPIIIAHCYNDGSNGCHDRLGAGVSGYNYTTYAGLVVNASDGNLLNDLLRGVPHMMPKNGVPLATCDIEKIVKWVHEGYPDN